MILCCFHMFFVIIIIIIIGLIMIIILCAQCAHWPHMGPLGPSSPMGPKSPTRTQCTQCASVHSSIVKNQESALRRRPFAKWPFYPDIRKLHMILYAFKMIFYRFHMILHECHEDTEYETSIMMHLCKRSGSKGPLTSGRI